MGLLDSQQQPQGMPQGGLLNMASMPQMPQQGMQQSQGKEMQYAMALSKSPNMQTAQQVIMAMRRDGIGGADEIEKIIMQVGDNPPALKKIADAVIQHLSGQ